MTGSSGARPVGRESSRLSGVTHRHDRSHRGPPGRAGPGLRADHDCPAGGPSGRDRAAGRRPARPRRGRPDGRGGADGLVVRREVRRGPASSRWMSRKADEEGDWERSDFQPLRRAGRGAGPALRLREVLRLRAALRCVRQLAAAGVECRLALAQSVRAVRAGTRPSPTSVSR